MNKGCVAQCEFAIYIKKYLEAKEQLWKFKYFTMQKYNTLQKNPLKETKILQDIQNSITKSQVSTQSQNIIFRKSSYKNRHIIIT
jgi:hypothetical protein